MNERLTPYEKGRTEAWLSPVTRNPYDRNSEAEREWFCGWQDAKEKRIAEIEAECDKKQDRIEILEFKINALQTQIAAHRIEPVAINGGDE